MRTVNMSEAKACLSKLVDQAANGDPFIIAKAGKPLVKVTPLDAPDPEKLHRIGFLSGWIETPADFDQMGAVDIADMFGLSE